MAEGWVNKIQTQLNKEQQYFNKTLFAFHGSAVDEQGFNVVK